LQKSNASHSYVLRVVNVAGSFFIIPTLNYAFALSRLLRYSSTPILQQNERIFKPQGMDSFVAADARVCANIRAMGPNKPQHSDMFIIILYPRFLQGGRGLSRPRTRNTSR